jgi:hypothetical protein
MITFERIQCHLNEEEFDELFSQKHFEDVFLKNYFECFTYI